MAYINAEQTKVKRNALKAAFPGWKFSVRNDNHSSLQVCIMAADVDFFADDAVAESNQAMGYRNQASLNRGCMSVNHYWLDTHWQGEALKALRKIVDICQDGNHDNSDVQSDYFDVGWYFNLEIGKWDRPFELRVNKKAA